MDSFLDTCNFYYYVYPIQNSFPRSQCKFLSFPEYYSLEITTEKCYLWSRAKQILHSVMFSLESGCVCPHSLRLKSPAQANKENWNCLFGEAQITKGRCYYIMKSKPRHIVYPWQVAVWGFLQAHFSTHVTLQTWSWGWGPYGRLWLRVIKTPWSQSAWVQSSVCHFPALTLASLLFLPKPLLWPHL